MSYVLIYCTKICQNLAKDEYESNFISAVVPPGEIGVKFDDIGALEDVKKALNELVILPMRRPELFSRGNLLRVVILVPCMHSQSNKITVALSFHLSDIEEAFVSLAKEYYFLVLLELGKPFWPRHLQQKQAQILSA